MRPLKGLTRAMVVVAVFMGVLTLSAPPAEANSSGPICATGVLTADGQCEVEVDPASNVCPAIEADGECFDLVPTISDCESGTLLANGSCRIPVPDTIELSCLPPSEPTDDGGCETVVPANESLACQLGDLVNGTCLLFIGPADETPPTCPEFQDADGCYTTVPAALGCTEGFLDGDVCVTESDPVLGEPQCAVATFTIIVEFPDGDHCGTTTTGTVDCGLAEPIGDGLCRDAFLSFGCEIYFDFFEIFDFIEQDQGGCYGILFDAPSPPCIAPETPIFEGNICAEFLGPADACPDEYIFDGEECVLVFPAEPNCPADHPLVLGFDDAGNPICYQDFGPLVALFGCPDGSELVFEEVCVSEVPAEFTCAAGSLINDDECRIPQDPDPGELACLEGQLLDGGCFDDNGPPVTVFACPVGMLLGTTCLVPSEPTQTVSCGEALGEPGDCHILAPAASVCPANATAGAEFPESCRAPVDRVGGGCPDGATDLDGRCVEFSDPVWFCNNELVTINMVLGASGNGTGADDVILGTPGNDVIRGFAGNDIICGGGGNDLLTGNSGSDTIFGEDGADRVIGGSGDDYLDGGADNDLIFGGSGDDEIWGSYGDDRLNGSRGDDQLRGGAGNDDINGQRGNDILRGGLGDDDLDGGPDLDSCVGGPGTGTVVNCEPAV